VEFHCHGGRAVVESLLSALAAIDGLRAAEPGEFTRRAFENGRIDLTEAEGGLRKQVAAWQERLVGLSAQAERAIDYDEEDEAIDPAFGEGVARLAGELAAWLERPRVEPLKDGVRVVVAGPPNAGKSSLLNAIAGEERAIVTDLPGTTRDHIEVPLAIAGVPVLLIDTAGLRETGDQVEAIGVARASALVAVADVVVWLGAPQDAPAHPGLLLVHAKADLGGTVPAGSLAVSAVTGQGLSALLERIGAHARSLLPGEDAIALNRRQAGHIGEAAGALRDAETATELVLVAESLRSARTAFDRLTGRAGIEDVLDSLFSRFCLGK